MTSGDDCREENISTMVTERDIRNYISYAQEKGRAEGLAEGEVIGETKGIHKTARNMKAKGISVEMIMECTGLSVEEIERL
jgi:predicted transposase/invertase (TIGR01784 family)